MACDMTRQGTACHGMARHIMANHAPQAKLSTLLTVMVRAMSCMATIQGHAWPPCQVMPGRTRMTGAIMVTLAVHAAMAVLALLAAMAAKQQGCCGDLASSP